MIFYRLIIYRLIELGLARIVKVLFKPCILSSSYIAKLGTIHADIAL
jgi:hypothetical protein